MSIIIGIKMGTKLKECIQCGKPSWGKRCWSCFANKSSNSSRVNVWRSKLKKRKLKKRTDG
tara:strand:- start:11882 stop:12064 length:183 start_codon:yes stop_codon:yes gene_type:complete